MLPDFFGSLTGSPEPFDIVDFNRRSKAANDARAAETLRRSAAPRPTPDRVPPTEDEWAAAKAAAQVGDRGPLDVLMRRLGQRPMDLG